MLTLSTLKITLYSEKHIQTYFSNKLLFVTFSGEALDNFMLKQCPT